MPLCFHGGCLTSPPLSILISLPSLFSPSFYHQASPGLSLGRLTPGNSVLIFLPPPGVCGNFDKIMTLFSKLVGPLLRSRISRFIRTDPPSFALIRSKEHLTHPPPCAAHAPASPVYSPRRYFLRFLVDWESLSFPHEFQVSRSFIWTVCGLYVSSPVFPCL